MNILLGLTGSVASSLAPKIVDALQLVGEVKVVYTEPALHFFHLNSLSPTIDLEYVYGDNDYWRWENELFPTGHRYRGVWKKDDPALHIDLREWADIFVVAPLTANTLAKFANGLCDNLLTGVFRAWDFETKKVVVAPAMNTVMWNNSLTTMQLNLISSLFDVRIVDPIDKVLACGTVGKGAMARIEDICKIVEAVYQLGKNRAIGVKLV